MDRPTDRQKYQVIEKRPRDLIQRLSVNGSARSVKMANDFANVIQTDILIVSLVVEDMMQLEDSILDEKLKPKHISTPFVPPTARKMVCFDDDDGK